jgi:signal peptidase
MHFKQSAKTETLIFFPSLKWRSSFSTSIAYNIYTLDITEYIFNLVTEKLKMNVGSLLSLPPRKLARQVLSLVMVVASAYMAWKGLSLLTNCESPVVVVLSESMEPAFARGDLLFLTLDKTPFEVGDVTVFRIKGHEIPIVHRLLELHIDNSTGKHYMLTKGDNNRVDDRGLYNPGQFWISEDDVIGRVQGHAPYLGIVTILLNDYPQLKIAVLLMLGLGTLLSKDEV